MPKFSGNAAVYGGQYLGEVEVDDAEEAYEKLADNFSGSLCHQCSSKVEDVQIGPVTVLDEDGNEVINEQDEERGRQEAPLREALAALRELVACKDLHDRLIGEPELNGEYSRRKPAAWDEARRILAAHDKEGTP